MPAAEPAPAAPPPDRRAWLRRRARIILWLVLFATVLGWIGAPWWAALAQHLTLHLGAVALLCWLALWIGRGWLTKWLALLLAVVHLGPVAWTWMPGPIAAPPALPVRVMSVNLLSSNTATAAVMAWIRSEQPDLVAAQEVSPAWATALNEALAVSHPHRLVQPSTDNFGIALYSRWPLPGARTDLLGGPVPSVIARIDAGDGAATRAIQVIVTHPPPPMSGQYAEWHDRQTAALADLVAASRDPVVLVGDLNATPGSAAHRRLLAAGLRDTRQGHGWEPTWPASLGWAGIPIDHVLVSPAVGCPRRDLSPDLGSDHRGVVADLRIP
jgi:endonuclease/exonuclease/phosphatase (EEP) superfamily protein YafD